jgi:hypothetical protein
LNTWADRLEDLLLSFTIGAILCVVADVALTHAQTYTPAIVTALSGLAWVLAKALRRH